jgi:hypothetical protein
MTGAHISLAFREMRDSTTFGPRLNRRRSSWTGRPVANGEGPVDSRGIPHLPHGKPGQAKRADVGHPSFVTDQAVKIEVSLRPAPEALLPRFPCLGTRWSRIPDHNPDIRRIQRLLHALLRGLLGVCRWCPSGRFECVTYFFWARLYPPDSACQICFCAFRTGSRNLTEIRPPGGARRDLKALLRDAAHLGSG